VSKRVTLTDEDIELIQKLLKSINPVKPFNDVEFASMQRKQQIMDKLRLDDGYEQKRAGV